MISANQFIEERLERQTQSNSQCNKEVYYQQKDKCMKEIDWWFHNCIMKNCITILFELPPHPKLLADLKKLGYITKMENFYSNDYPYCLDILLSDPNNEIS